MLAILKHCHHRECTVTFSFEIPLQVTITVFNTVNKREYSQSLPWDHIDNERIIGAIDFCLGKFNYITLEDLKQISVDDLDFSLRARNVLQSLKVKTLADILDYTPEQLMKHRNMGNKTMNEVENIVYQKGLEIGVQLTLGMDLSKLPE